MDRFSLYVAGEVAIWVSLFTSILTAVFLAILSQNSKQQEPYLKRVAKKYSIRPFDLR